LKVVPRLGASEPGPGEVHTKFTQNAPAQLRKFQAADLLEASRYAHAIAEKLGGDVYRIADTGSMEPTISKNTLVVILPVRADEIAVGDIITFTRRGGPAVTHRVTQIAGDGVWRTKGDANKITDVAPLRYSQVLGRVAYAIRFPAEAATP
jgi:signal peptidase I